MLNTSLGSQITVYRLKFYLCIFPCLFSLLNLLEKNCFSNSQPFLQFHHRVVLVSFEADLADSSENAFLKHLKVAVPLLSVLFSQQQAFKAKINRNKQIIEIILYM